MTRTVPAPVREAAELCRAALIRRKVPSKYLDGARSVWWRTWSAEHPEFKLHRDSFMRLSE